MKELNILTQLSTEQLDKMLRAELNKTPVDGALVKTICHILEDRDADQPQNMTPQIQAAWDDFCAKDPAQNQPVKKSVVFKITAMAAVLCVAFVAFAPRYAQAESWWDWLTGWTNHIFAFGSGDETTASEAEYVFQTAHPGLQQVYDTVTSLGITDPVVPMWIPEEYTLISCEQNSNKKSADVFAIFSNETNRLVFRAYVLGADTGNQYQKDAQDVAVCEAHGTTYYIVRNLDSWSVAWIQNNVECMLSVDCPEDVLYKIIWSIYTKEEK